LLKDSPLQTTTVLSHLSSLSLSRLSLLSLLSAKRNVRRSVNTRVLFRVVELFYIFVASEKTSLDFRLSWLSVSGVGVMVCYG